jgi:hypothetical protein
MTLPGPNWCAFVLMPSKHGFLVKAWPRVGSVLDYEDPGTIIAATTSVESARASLPSDAKQSHGAMAKSLPSDTELWIRTEEK